MKSATQIGVVLTTFIALASISFAAGKDPIKDKVSLKRNSPVIFPLYSKSEKGSELGIGIADRAGSELFATGNYNHFHLKQVFSMARGHRFSAEQLSTLNYVTKSVRILGSQSGVFGTLEKLPNGSWMLKFTVFNVASRKQKEGKQNLGSNIASAVASGGRTIAEAVASLDGLKLTNAEAQPHTKSEAAMEAYLTCHSILMNQPMGLRKSHVINPKQIILARRGCQKAIKADPDFAAAWASLSLAYSLSFRKEDAARALKKAQSFKGYLAFQRIAQYWWTTRFEGSAEGASVLRQSLKNFPGALIFLTYLGEHLNITREYDEALEIWNRYLGLLEASPYAMAQKGYSLARLSKLDES
ncbi:MAG: hypothetical protein JRJ19_07170, partial [Deltaproteobacteria bacterium]|nr:hypothetical protein [Deltaproteobacteria bacterium]